MCKFTSKIFFLSVGSTTDEHGHTRPVAFMPYRVNGQYIMEVAKSYLIQKLKLK